LSPCYPIIGRREREHEREPVGSLSCAKTPGLHRTPARHELRNEKRSSNYYLFFLAAAFLAAGFFAAFFLAAIFVTSFYW
jgi:hypothetical protein